MLRVLNVCVVKKIAHILFQAQLQEDLFATYIKFGYLADARDLGVRILSKVSGISFLDPQSRAYQCYQTIENRSPETIARTPCTLVEQLLIAADDPDRQRLRTICQDRLSSSTSSVLVR